MQRTISTAESRIPPIYFEQLAMTLKRFFRDALTTFSSSGKEDCQPKLNGQWVNTYPLRIRYALLAICLPIALTTGCGGGGGGGGGSGNDAPSTNTSGDTQLEPDVPPDGLVTLRADSSIATGGLEPLAWGQWITVQGYDTGDEPALVTYGSSGLAIAAGRYPDQIDYDAATAQSEALVFQFAEPATDIRIRLSNMETDEWQGLDETGAWIGYDADGNEVANGNLDPRQAQESTPIYREFALSAEHPLSALRIVGTAYNFGTSLYSDRAENNSDFNVYGISFRIGSLTDPITPAPTPEPAPSPSPSPVPDSNVKYGPDGTAWASFTPAPDAAPTAVLSSMQELVTALRNANSGDVFHLNSITIESDSRLTLNDKLAAERLSTLDRNVLIRPAPGARVVVRGGLKIHLPRLTWAFLQVDGALHIMDGADRNRVARTKLTANGRLFVTYQVADVEFVEVAAPERGLGGDRVQIKSLKTAPGAPTDISFVRCWFEGTDNNPGDHSDTMQWTAGHGAMVLRNTYLGPAGNNATMQVAAEQQPPGLAYARFELDTVFLGGAKTYGNGNVVFLPSVAEPPIFRNVEWVQMKGYQRPGQALPSVMVNNRVAKEPIISECLDPDCTQRVRSKRLKELYPQNEFDVSVTPPVFVAPPWWW